MHFSKILKIISLIAVPGCLEAEPSHLDYS